MLVPRWLDAETEPGNRDYFDKLHSAIAAAGLTENFVFHEWISEALIAEYYSLADVTMCIGSCVETFGNSPFESLGCGTPAILSRVATYRDLLPDEHVDRVDYGDIDAAAERGPCHLERKTPHFGRDTCPFEVRISRSRRWSRAMPTSSSMRGNDRSCPTAFPASPKKHVTAWRPGVIFRRARAFTTIFSAGGEGTVGSSTWSKASQTVSWRGKSIIKNYGAGSMTASSCQISAPDRIQQIEIETDLGRLQLRFQP